MTGSTQLDYGAGLLACGLADVGADTAQLTLGLDGEVVIVLRKGEDIVRLGRVPRGSAFVRWTTPACQRAKAG